MSKKAKAKTARQTASQKAKQSDAPHGKAKVSALLERIKPCLSVLGGADEFSNVLHFAGKSVSAYNYKVLAQVNLPGDLVVDGVLDGKLLGAVLGSMPDGDVKCQSDKGEVKLLVNDSELVLQRRDSKSFKLPKFDATKKSQELTFSGSQIADWANALERCLVCCDASILEASLLGVWARITDKGIKLSASDGFRIGMATLGKESVPEGVSGDLQVFLSMDLTKLFSESMTRAGSMVMTVTPSFVTIKSDAARFVGMKVENKIGKGAKK